MRVEPSRRRIRIRLGKVIRSAAVSTPRYRRRPRPPGQAAAQRAPQVAPQAAVGEREPERPPAPGWPPSMLASERRRRMRSRSPSPRSRRGARLEGPAQRCAVRRRSWRRRIRAGERADRRPRCSPSQPGSSSSGVSRPAISAIADVSARREVDPDRRQIGAGGRAPPSRRSASRRRPRRSATSAASTPAAQRRVDDRLQVGAARQALEGQRVGEPDLAQRRRASPGAARRRSWRAGRAGARSRRARRSTPSAASSAARAPCGGRLGRRQQLGLRAHEARPQPVGRLVEGDRQRVGDALARRGPARPRPPPPPTRSGSTTRTGRCGGRGRAPRRAARPPRWPPPGRAARARRRPRTRPPPAPPSGRCGP